MNVIGRLLCTGLLICCVTACTLAREIPRPLPDHPGNIFLEGEDVSISIPTAIKSWKLIDIDGKMVTQSAASLAQARAHLGKLGVGWYELVPDAGPRIWLAVLKPLAVSTPVTSPIAADVAMAWFYKGPERPKVASLCALAGLNWVRDRLSWGEVEKSRGQFAADTRYDDTARVQAEAGLRVLQVNHSTPHWCKGESDKRFPPDLRDAYRFHRAIASRWKGKVLAIEPWNEADIPMFGGHTGAEMASLQKAAYWGIRAGNPEALVGLNVLALSRATTIDDLAQNDANVYFDTCNLHHYAPVSKLAAWYEPFRKLGAGKPLWVSECSMPVQWSGDEAAKELSDEMLRVQARRVAMTFASSIHEGSAATFYFLIPHYVEKQTQFGLLKKDLTPRPGFVALAACGRLLADARPLGKLKDAGVSGYLLAARPDGQAADVLVAWADKGAPVISLPATARLYDHLGREQARDASQLTAGLAPIFAVLPTGSHVKLALEVAPKLPAPRPPQAPSPIVLQATCPSTATSVNDSAYRINPETEQAFPLFVYNFGSAAPKGTLEATAPAGWVVSLTPNVQIEPMGRAELKLTINPAKGAKAGTVRITGQFGAAGSTVLSLRLVTGR